MKIVFVSVIVAVLLIGGALFFTKDNTNRGEVREGENVSIIDGVQIIDVYAKGGYFPAITRAKAGMPTTLNIRTAGTFDCSAAFTIPSLGYRTYLPASGVTEVEIPIKETGEELQGLCGMGMYGFVVRFE